MRIKYLKSLALPRGLETPVFAVRGRYFAAPRNNITPATSAAHTKGCVDVIYKKGAAVAANPFIVAVIMNGKVWPSSSYR